MALVFSSVSPLGGKLNHTTQVHLNPFVHCKISNCSRLRYGKNGCKFIVRNQRSNFQTYHDFDWEDLEEEDDDEEGSPWEGAVVYKRNSSVTHLEYCTTLERLGLGKLSTNVSRSRASVMGLRVTKDVKDYPDGTPLLISLDVTRKKHSLRLDGIIRTVITLGCNRYHISLEIQVQ